MRVLMRCEWQLQRWGQMGLFNDWVERSGGAPLVLWKLRAGANGTHWTDWELEPVCDASSGAVAMPSAEMIVDFMLQVWACEVSQLCTAAHTHGRDLVERVTRDTQLRVRARVHMLVRVQMATGEGMGLARFHRTMRFSKSLRIHSCTWFFMDSSSCSWSCEGEPLRSRANIV